MDSTVNPQETSTRHKTQDRRHKTRNTRYKTKGVGDEVGGRESRCKEGRMCGQGGQTSTQKGHTRHIQEGKAYMGIVKRLVNIKIKSRED